jgi:hypothetical protein
LDRFAGDAALVGMNKQRLDLPTQTSLLPRFAGLAVGLALTVTGCALDAEDDVGDEDTTAFAASKKSGCFTTRMGAGAEGAEILPVDLDKEKLGKAVGSIPSHDISSLGVIDNSILTCTHEGGIQIFDLATQKLEQLPRRCDGITSDGKLIWVNSVFDQALLEYEGLQALRDDVSSRALPSAFATRLGAGEGRLLAAWHSAAEVLDVDLATGEAKPFPLPGYDGWIFGLAARGESNYVVGGWVERGIRAYDRTSGALTATLFASEFLQGLACTDK